LDIWSVEQFKDDKESTDFLADEKAKKGYENTKKLSDVNADDYVAIVYVGGHGPCYDLPEDETNIKLAEAFWKQGKVVSAVCHGPAALVNVKDENGKSIFAGRKATSFGNLEEEEIKLADLVPFLLETRLKELGANYQRNEKLWGSCVTVDGQRMFILFIHFIFYFSFI
jgi:putative intracellular protease/amidase